MTENPRTENPSDEFDAVPETSERQGVHRERFIPARSSGLALKITVGILALLIVLGAAFILPRLGIAGASTAGPSIVDGAIVAGTSPSSGASTAGPSIAGASTAGPSIVGPSVVGPSIAGTFRSSGAEPRAGG